MVKRKACFRSVCVCARGDLLKGVGGSVEQELLKWQVEAFSDKTNSLNISLLSSPQSFCTLSPPFTICLYFFKPPLLSLLFFIFV